MRLIFMWFMDKSREEFQSPSDWSQMIECRKYFIRPIEKEIVTNTIEWSTIDNYLFPINRVYISSGLIITTAAPSSIYQSSLFIYKHCRQLGGSLSIYELAQRYLWGSYIRHPWASAHLGCRRSGKILLFLLFLGNNGEQQRKQFPKNRGKCRGNKKLATRSDALDIVECGIYVDSVNGKSAARTNRSQCKRLYT